VTLDDPTFAKLSNHEQDALLRGVAKIRDEHKHDTKSDAIFNRERRIHCRGLILKNLPGLIKALEDPAGSADVDDAFFNEPFRARELHKALRLVHDHYRRLEPWPEQAYSASFDWEGYPGGGGERLSTERQRRAVVALVKLLDCHDGLERLGVRVSSHDKNPGFALLQCLTGRLLKKKRETDTLQKLVKHIRIRRVG
jgi:hypothetical protein